MFRNSPPALNGELRRLLSKKFLILASLCTSRRKSAATQSQGYESPLIARRYSMPNLEKFATNLQPPDGPFQYQITIPPDKTSLFTGQSRHASIQPL